MSKTSIHDQIWSKWFFYRFFQKWSFYFMCPNFKMRSENHWFLVLILEKSIQSFWTFLKSILKKNPEIYESTILFLFLSPTLLTFNKETHFNFTLWTMQLKDCKKEISVQLSHKREVFFVRNQKFIWHTCRAIIESDILLRSHLVNVPFLFAFKFLFLFFTAN